MYLIITENQSFYIANVKKISLQLLLLRLFIAGGYKNTLARKSVVPENQIDIKVRKKIQ